MYTFSWVKGMYDNGISVVQEYSWDEVVDIFGTHTVEPDKQLGLAFVPARYKTVDEGAEPQVVTEFGLKVAKPGTVGRVASNVAEYYCLPLDFDGGVTIEEVEVMLEGIKHVGYTSYNHLKDGVVNKFRIIIPLKEPVSAEQFKLRSKSLAGLFPTADQASFRVGQIMFAPARAEQSKVHKTWSVDGASFDLLALEPETVQRYEQRQQPVGVSGGTGKVLWGTVDIVGLFSKAGLYRRSLGNGKHEVTCPNASQHTPGTGDTAAIWEGGYGFNCWHSHCAGKRVRDFFSAAEIAEFCQREPEELQLVLSKIEDEPEEAIEAPTETVKIGREFNEPLSRKQRAVLLEDFVRIAVSHQHSIIQTAEGFGKSTVLVRELIGRKKNILFCCDSNEQVKAKMDDFKLYAPKRAVSFRAHFKDNFGYEPIIELDKRNKPVVDYDATAELLVERENCSQDEATESISILRGQAIASRQLTSGLVITTFALGNVIFNNECGNLGKDWVVIVDDPSLSNLQTEVWAMDEEGNPALSEKREIGEIPFATEFFGQNSVIWTTTEKLTSKAILNQHNKAYVKVVDENLKTRLEQLKIIPTKLCYKALRPVIPGINKCVVQELHLDRSNIIANGIGEEFNLVNNKGRNDLTDHSVVVASHPHPVELMNAAAAVGLGPEAGKLIAGQFIVDRINQAIGRNQGYRGQDGVTTTLLCSPGLQYLLECFLRYEIHRVAEFRQSKGNKWHGMPVMLYDTNPIHLRWEAYCNAWNNHVIILGNRVINTLTLEMVKLDALQMESIRKALDKPVRMTEGKLKWREVLELVDGEGRRNYQVRVGELVKLVNDEIRLRRAGDKPKRNVFVVHPDGSKHKYRVGDVVPAGSKLKNGRRYTICQDNKIGVR